MGGQGEGSTIIREDMSLYRSTRQCTGAPATTSIRCTKGSMRCLPQSSGGPRAKVKECPWLEQRELHADLHSQTGPEKTGTARIWQPARLSHPEVAVGAPGEPGHLSS